MNTKDIKNAIKAEMADGVTLLKAKATVLEYFYNRLEIAGQEVKREIEGRQ